MKVLLVDDDEKVVRAVRLGLEAEGFTVDVAFNGIDGLWSAAGGGDGVIVLDILVPRGEGSPGATDSWSAPICERQGTARRS